MEQPKKKRFPLWIILGIVGVLAVACLVCVGGAMLSGKGTPTPGAVAQGGSAPTAGQEAAETAVPVVAEPTAEPTVAPVGVSRDNPVPLGDAYVASDGIELTVLQVERGADAWAKIHDYNMLNSEPDEGKEYVLVVVGVKFTGDASETKRISSTYFRVVGEKGAIYEAPIMLVLGEDFAPELFGGGSTEGEVGFQVAEGEQQLVLIYSGPGTKACYLSLE